MARGECLAAFRSASRIDFGRPPGLPDCPDLNRLRVGGHPSVTESSPVLRPIASLFPRCSQLIHGLHLRPSSQQRRSVYVTAGSFFWWPPNVIIGR